MAAEYRIFAINANLVDTSLVISNSAFNSNMHYVLTFDFVKFDIPNMSVPAIFVDSHVHEDAQTSTD